MTAAATPAPADEVRSTFIMLPPPPDLAPAVEYVWQLVLPGDAPADAFWRVVVDGYVDVATTLALTPELLRAAGLARASAAARGVVAEALAASRSVVCGAATAARALPMTAPLLLTGARFRLGAAAGVLRQSPAALVDGSRPLGDVLDARAAADVVAALAAGVDEQPPAAGAAADPDADARALRAIARASVCALARRLAARAARKGGAPDAPDARVRGALRLLDRGGEGAAAGGMHPSRLPAAVAPGEAGAARVAAVARALGVSPRTLERLFAEHVGFAPRTYQRLRRVGAVAEALERDAVRAALPGRGAARPATLSALAHGLGYTDHAHMTREFSRVMGVAPSRYRREALDAPVARRVGAVAAERSVPLGTVGREPAA